MIDDDTLVGQQIGNYRLKGVIARGAYGSVYLGQHWLFKDELAVAVKLLHARVSGKEKREQFMREASLLRRLKHSSILPLIDAGMQQGIPYLVTIYAAGGSLRDLLQEQKEQPLPLEKALWILQRLGDALSYAHRQHVVHRDLKPENILFGAESEVFLADFGLALALESSQTGYVGSQGTPLYMAPEQFEGLISPKSDQYAFACLAYELLSGRRPFIPLSQGWESIWYHHTHVAPPPPTRFNPAIPAYIEQALLRAMAKDRAERFGDMAALLEALKPPTQTASPISRLRTRLAREQAIVSTPGPTLLPPEELTPDEMQEKQTGAYQVAREKQTGVHPASRPLVQEKQTGTHQASNALDLAVNAAELLDQTSDEYRKQGHAFRDAGVYDRALEAYEQAIQLDPNNPLAYYGQAKIYWEQKRYKEAILAYNHIIRLQPGDPFFYALKGNALYELGRYVEALSAYNQALALKQDNASWHARRACILHALQRPAEALHSYDLAIALKPGEAYYYACKGDILSELKHEDEALRMYAKAVELDPRESWHRQQKSFIRREEY
ncbi:MAG TPA: serine/threonine-protein kinase [Ktedonobacteraceae bacterium]|jgi:serine/threonine-protein kinase